MIWGSSCLPLSRPWGFPLRSWALLCGSWNAVSPSGKPKWRTGKEKLFILIVQSSGAAIALGEATARAVQRIPDAHCNGDMHAALAYATDIKHKQKDFLMEQGIQALWD